MTESKEKKIYFTAKGFVVGNKLSNGNRAVNPAVEFNDEYDSLYEVHKAIEDTNYCKNLDSIGNFEYVKGYHMTVYKHIIENGKEYVQIADEIFDGDYTRFDMDAEVEYLLPYKEMRKVGKGKVIMKKVLRYVAHGSIIGLDFEDKKHEREITFGYDKVYTDRNEFKRAVKTAFKDGSFCIDKDILTAISYKLDVRKRYEIEVELYSETFDSEEQ